MGVAQAMLVGTIICLAVTRASPQEFSKTFFAGLGKGYGEILGIIIAAGVFAAGLTATGLVQSFVDLLKESNVYWEGLLLPLPEQWLLYPVSQWLILWKFQKGPLCRVLSL